MPAGAPRGPWGHPRTATHKRAERRSRPGRCRNVSAPIGTLTSRQGSGRRDQQQPQGRPTHTHPRCRNLRRGGASRPTVPLPSGRIPPPPPDGCAQAGPFFSSPPKGPPLPGSLTCPGPRPHRRILGFFLAASSDTPTRPRLRGGGADCVPPFWQHALTPPAPMGRRRPSSWDARRANRLDIGVGRPGRPPRRVLLSVVGVWGGGGSGGCCRCQMRASYLARVCRVAALTLAAVSRAPARPRRGHTPQEREALRCPPPCARRLARGVGGLMCDGLIDRPRGPAGAPPALSVRTAWHAVCPRAVGGWRGYARRPPRARKRVPAGVCSAAPGHRAILI